MLERRTKESGAKGAVRLCSDEHPFAQISTVRLLEEVSVQTSK